MKTIVSYCGVNAVFKNVTRIGFDPSGWAEVYPEAHTVTLYLFNYNSDDPASMTMQVQDAEGKDVMIMPLPFTGFHLDILRNDKIESVSYRVEDGMWQDS